MISSSLIRVSRKCVPSFELLLPSNFAYTNYEGIIIAFSLRAFSAALMYAA